MRRIGWIALTTAAMWAGTLSIRANEPAPGPDSPLEVPLQNQPSTDIAPTANPEPAPISDSVAAPASDGKSPVEISSDQIVSGPSDRCPKCGGPMTSTDCGCCSSCGHRQLRVARVLDWLFYVPADHGKAKCCQTCMSCPPPAWAFFPCEGGGRCNTCVAGASTAVVAKATEAATNGQPVKSAYPPPQAARPIPQVAPTVAPQAAPMPANPPARLSSYAPQAVSPTMPILDPSQFRRQPNNGN